MTDRPLRVMWLLNHSSARSFEMAMLERLGVTQVFLPKKFPPDIAFRSASISYAKDRDLSIPAEDLVVLNEQDWYGTPSKQAWEIANRHFDVVFFIFYKPEIFRAIANNFQGTVLWRAYGLVAGATHGALARQLAPDDAMLSLRTLGRRFWFAEAYPHLHEAEPDFISRRKVYLPLGLANAEMEDRWSGNDARIYFVCADIEANQYNRMVFDEFAKEFAGFPYAVAGAQAVKSSRPEVLGYVEQAEHERNMREFRVMFYHSREPNHIHYHPFEAVRAGMPLVFMAGGMLDRLGGVRLPGRCRTWVDARRKIRRILDGDGDLIARIRASQGVLLEPMKLTNCEPAWRAAFRRIAQELEADRATSTPTRRRGRRLAVILPAGYRGGTLRGAKLLAQALHEGSRQWGEPAEILFLHPDERGTYADDEFDDLHPGVKCRPFRWQTLTAAEARRAMRYAGHSGWEPDEESYVSPDDGIGGLGEYDAWVVISDRLPIPLLPLNPYFLMVYDYLQRYIPFMAHGEDAAYLAAARRAALVITTTEFTRSDAIQYAGADPQRVARLPMLAPSFPAVSKSDATPEPGYFLWTTNANPHKNHVNALAALKRYYEELDGKLDCHVTGVNTQCLPENPPPHLIKSMATTKASRHLRERLRWRGELDERDYRRALSEAAFLWHPGRIDNGTFSVIEAATLGVPALSSDYPAMREMDAQFSLNLVWMDADQPADMASRLKEMELNWAARKASLPSLETLARQSVTNLAAEYWRAIRECV